MCGIAGIISSSSWTDRYSAALRAMQSSLAHRGPDDQGIWTHPTSGAGLTHTRLAILDLSPAGHQPMLSSDERYIITFNGEIYNFRELRSECEAKGLIFRTHTDTEVLLHLYATQGASMVTRLRGMFAFCIWDQQERTAFLARDPLGIKPLFYSNLKGELAFASELRAIRNSGLVSSQLDGEAITLFLETGSVPEPLTLLSDVRCLEAGHSLTWVAGHIESNQYWQPQIPETTVNPDAVLLTRNALLDSMQAHFVSDVPVGVFLSGGIDSTALVALARELGQHDLQTFSIGVDDPSLDESSIARKTAAHFGTQHHEWLITGDIGASNFAAFLEQMDQPSIDGFNTFTVSSFAREHGMKVVLSGLGGDELFGGYPSFQRVPKLARLSRRIHAIPGAAPALGALLTRFAPQPKWRRLGSFLQKPATVANAYRTFRGIFSPAEARQLACHYTLSSKPQSSSPTTPPGQSRFPTVEDTVSVLELTTYMRNQLLKDSDVMSMAHGLEVRVPFVDRVLLDTLFRLPSSQRIQPGKKLLLQAVPEVPEWVANQPKRGFMFPYEKWLEASWGDSFLTATKSIPFANPTWYQRWAVFMLDHWLAKTA
jgi:asparagine synthase (glutamine-hydrolysing)